MNDAELTKSRTNEKKWFNLHYNQKNWLGKNIDNRTLSFERDYKDIVYKVKVKPYNPTQ